MKLKLLALALTFAGASAQAAPTAPTCAPMEITHSGSAGLSYNLSCNGGNWAFTFMGSVPAGTGAVQANYRLSARNRDGSAFAENRTVRLPSPGMLGQALIREAVVLDSGDLALRDCPDFNCTSYRPLGDASRLSKATVVVAPEQQRLRSETAALRSELSRSQSTTLAQGSRVSELEASVASLQAQLNQAQQARATQAGTEVAELKSDLKKASSERDSASAEARMLSEQLAAVAPKMQKLEEERQAALKGAKKVAKDMLEALDKYQDLEKAKEKADKALEATNNKLLDLSAKLQAANLTRDLSVQSATAANADADTQHIKAMEAVKALETTRGQLSSLLAERDSLNSQLKAKPLEIGQSQVALAVLPAKMDLKPVVQPAPAPACQVQPLPQATTSKQQRAQTSHLSYVNSLQAAEIEKLRAQLEKVSGKKVPVLKLPPPPMVELN